MKKAVLIVDDQEHICRDLGKHLQKREYTVFTAFSKENARKIVLAEKPDYAIIDLKLYITSEYAGIQVLNFSERNQPGIKTIILSAYPFDHAQGQLKTQICHSEFEKIEQNYIFKGSETNYIKAVLDKLKELEGRQNKKKCFVILPFADTKSCTREEWNEIFEGLIKPAVEEPGFNYECIKPDFFHGEIIEPFLNDLNRSDLLIADITDQNPNVLYGLGVRHSLRDSTIIITQETDDILFDLEFYTVLTYGWKFEKEREKFAADIKEKITFIEQDVMKTRSPVQKYLNP